MEDKKLLNNDSNLIFLKFANETGVFNFKEYIYNFLNEPQIKIEQKYDQLFSEAIKKNCFKTIVKEVENDFENKFVLYKLVEYIAYYTNFFFSRNFKNTQSIKILLKIFVLKQLFLNQLRYNPDIWFKLTNSQRKKVSLNKNAGYINYKIALLLVDFNIFENLPLMFSTEQQEVLTLILQSEGVEDFIELKNHLKLDVFKYLPLRMMLLQKEVVKQKHKLSTKENSKITYNTFMQMVSLFVSQNLIQKNSH